ncbi:hypothetical protein VTI74DRAFT_2417 [Chaetomium olivicolor]
MRWWKLKRRSRRRTTDRRRGAPSASNCRVGEWPSARPGFDKMKVRSVGLDCRRGAGGDGNSGWLAGWVDSGGNWADLLPGRNCTEGKCGPAPNGNGWAAGFSGWKTLWLSAQQWPFQERPIFLYVVDTGNLCFQTLGRCRGRIKDADCAT